MNSNKTIKLGDTVKHKLSPFTGVCTARAEYLYGCIYIEVTPNDLHEGVPIEGVWLDEASVEVVKSAPLEEKLTAIDANKPTGGAKRKTPKRSFPK